MRDLEIKQQYFVLKIVSIFIIVLLILVGIYLYVNRTVGGPYLVYACSENGNCHNLRADVYVEEGTTSVEKLYFNNGGFIYLDCVPGEFCYEIDGNTGLSKEGNNNWDITLIKRLEN